MIPKQGVLVKKSRQTFTRNNSLKMGIPQQRSDSFFVKVVILLVRIAPQLAYTPANCSRQAAQAKPEGLLRLPRANQQHKKKTAPLLMLSYAFYLNDKYPVLLQCCCPSYISAAVPLSVVDCTTSVIWAVCHLCTS